MSWDAHQYAQFEAERTRPARDLLAQLPADGVGTVVDLGCGPGNSTELLVERFPGAVIAGVDSSPQMIEAARKRLPGVGFELADIAGWRSPSAPLDLIFANASLQWVPDHARLLRALLAELAPGGRLAVQVPDNLDEPTHRLMREVAADGPWAAKLAGAAGARESRHDPSWYFQTLRDAGATAADVWRTTYHHPLPGGAQAVVEWFKATGLRPFIQPLEPDEREAFLARYQAEVARAYPAMADGTLLLPFPRLFFVARR